jgi:hypothetical protein
VKLDVWIGTANSKLSKGFYHCGSHVDYWAWKATDDRQARAYEQAGRPTRSWRRLTVLKPVQIRTDVIFYRAQFVQKLAKF